MNTANVYRKKQSYQPIGGYFKKYPLVGIFTTLWENKQSRKWVNGN